MLYSGNSHELDLRNIKNTRSFKIFGKWSVQASKHTHARVQWSHASVGLAQARPNDSFGFVQFSQSVSLVPRYYIAHSSSNTIYTTIFCSLQHLKAHCRAIKVQYKPSPQSRCITYTHIQIILLYIEYTPLCTDDVYRVCNPSVVDLGLVHIKNQNS